MGLAVPGRSRYIFVRGVSSFPVTNVIREPSNFNVPVINANIFSFFRWIADSLVPLGKYSMMYI